MGYPSYIWSRGKMITFMIVDAALELVPKEITKHPAIVKSAKRRKKEPSKVLLDISLHYSAMKKLKDFEKRGRPDIVHYSLLLILDSLLNRNNMLEIYVHTVNHKLIYVNPKTRLPKNYNRFVGLMEQLLDKGCVPPGEKEPLLKVLPISVREMINSRNFSNIFLLEKDGIPISLDTFSEKIVNEKKPLIMIGGFQRGEVSKEIRELVNETYSIYSGTLETWTVVCRILASLEKTLGLYGADK